MIDIQKLIKMNDEELEKELELNGYYYEDIEGNEKIYSNEDGSEMIGVSPDYIRFYTIDDEVGWVKSEFKRDYKN